MDIVSLPSSSPVNQQRRLCNSTVELVLPDEQCGDNNERSSTPLCTSTHYPNGDIHQRNSPTCERSDEQALAPANESVTRWEGVHSSDLGMRQATDIVHMSDFLEPPTHGYQLSYELALDNMLTPFTNQPMPTSYTEHVILEILTTERTYVGDLTDIVEGYIVPLEKSFQMNKADIDEIFGNLREIKEFNRSFLCTLEASDSSSERIGLCFSKKAEGFKELYSCYCNHYPSSIKALSRIQRDSYLSRALQTCKEELKHMLPLEAYLLKPVQRVLKYSLLLEQLVKHMSTEDAGFSKASSALKEMKSVSDHINSMKKEYEAEIQLQRLQTLIRGLEDLDLTKAGNLVLQEGLRYGGRSSVPSIRGRTDRHVYIFLFRKLMLITKKDDDSYQYKMHMEMKDMQLTEQIEKEPTCFQIRQVSTGNYYTLQAPSHESKVKWVKNIKMLLMESIPCLPEKARMLIMAGFPTDFAAKKSPKSPHQQRHLSADASPLSSRSEKQNNTILYFTAKRSPKSPRQQRHLPAGASPLPSRSGKQNGSRHTRSSSHLPQEYRKRSRTRSRTSPSMLTEQLARASLLATLQLQPFDEKYPTLVPANNSHLKHATPVQDSSQQMHEKTVIQAEKSDNEVTFTDSQSLKEVHDEPLIDEDREPLLNTSESLHPTPSVHPSMATPLSQTQYILTEDDLTPFNDLGNNDAIMEISSPNSSSLNQTDMQTLQFLLHGSQDSISEPDYVESIVVPHVPPPPQFAMVEDQSTVQEPTTSVDDQITSNEKLLHSTNIDRSQGSSLSVRDTCMSTEEKQYSTEESVVIPVIESPLPFCGNPDEELSFDEVLESLDLYASTTGKTAKKQAKEQKIQHRSPSIPRKEKKKKDRKRSMTVASIDTTTIIAAKEAMKIHTSLTPEPPERRNSKVQQLAREYSKRIKEIQKGSLFKRFSSVREEPPEQTERPYWLKELQKRRSPEDGRESDVNCTLQTNEQNGAGCTVHAENYTSGLTRHYSPEDSQSLQHTQSEATNISEDQNNATDPVEHPGKGRLKGWVKSIVAKYGNK